jgi:hypothetical protein
VPFATVLLTYGVIGFVNGVILILVFDVYYGSKEVMGALPTTPFDWFNCYLFCFSISLDIS